MSQVVSMQKHRQTGADETGYIPWEQFRLYYEVHGPLHGEPIVLVHGILLESSCNRDLAIALGHAGYRVVLLDLLGHGLSSRPGHSKWLRIDLFADQIRACMDVLGFEQAIVGGVSLGAISSLQLASEHAHRIRALVLEMPVMERAAPAAAMMLVPVLAATRYARPLLRATARLAQRLPSPRNNLARTLKNTLSLEPEDMAAIIHGVLVGPVVPPRSQREKITVPTLIIGHGGDWLHNLEDARVLAREMPNARFIVARSILELRMQPNRLLPKILSFLQGAAEQQAA